MERIYFKLSDSKLNYITLKKLGLIIRKINDEEINSILDNIFINILNKEIKALIKSGKKFLLGENYNFEEEKDRNEFNKFKSKFDSYNEYERYSILGLINLKRDFVFTRNTVRKSLKNIYTIDVDKTKFTKFYNLSEMNRILLLMLDFSRFLSCDDLASKIKLDYKKLFNFDNINLKNFDDYREGIVTNKFVIEYDLEWLSLLVDLLNSKDINFNTSFLTSIIFLNNSGGTIENDIVNKVSLIERLIVKEKSDNIQEQFVLKVGVICFNGKIKTEHLSNMLKSIYEIRSLIVHGNEKLLFEKIDIYARIFATSDLSKSKYENKNLVLSSVETFLDVILKDFLSVYIKNNLFCEYIKSN